MSTTKVTKKAQRRFLLLGTLSIIVMVLIIASISSYWVQIYRKGLEKQSLIEQIKVLKEEEADLKVEVQKLQDPDYIARYAREKYLYSKDGEFIIRIP
jgi:cell division protein DivIC